MVWEPGSGGWLLAAAYYEDVSGSDLTLSQLIGIIDHNGRLQVLRRVPFQKTNADVPQVTRWSPVDLADVNADGRTEIILEGDAYENHWYEVYGLRDGAFKMIYSGLGYYL